jgi:F-type H+-transporting ATPase subunit b
MQLNWSTFVLEFINFVVLVWLLKRLLYTPVLNAINARKKAVEKTLAEGEQARAEGLGLRKEYESRLQAWEKEKEAKQLQFERDREQQQARALAALDQELDKERQRQKVLDEKRIADLARKSEEAALALGARFSSRLLARVAGPELENKIVELFLAEVTRLPDGKRHELEAAFHDHTEPRAQVSTAYGLNQGQQKALASALAALLGQPVTCRFSLDPSLLAGVYAAMGPVVFHANLRDELDAFASAGNLEH